MSIRDRLLQLAERYEAAAAEHHRLMEQLRAWAAAAREEAEHLPATYESVKGDGMLTSARRAHARATSHDKLVVYCDLAGKTMGDVAKLAGRSTAYLSRCRRGIDPIRRSIAEIVRVATASAKHPDGFAVSKENWPGGFID